MKTISQLAISTVNGTKSIPLRNMPPEAWTSVFGGVEDYGIYELYKKVPWLYRGINHICEAVINMPRNQEELDTANLRVDWNFFLNEIVGDYLLAGAMFCVIEDNSFGKNKELRRFHPDTIKLETDETDGLKGFKRRISASSNETTYGRDELGYTWIPSRSSEIAIGDSPAMAALNAAGLLLNIDEFGKNYFDNGAINPTIAKIEEFETLDPAEQQRTKSVLERLFGRGNKNAHKVAPVGANVEFETVGSPMKELAVPELTDKKREDIATALGIPQSLLFSSAANYATARQDDYHFYNKTVVPLVRKIEGMLNAYFLSMNISVQIKFREQEMELFQRDEAARSDSLVNYVSVGYPVDLASELLGIDMDDEQWARLRNHLNKLEQLPAPDTNAVVTSVEDDDVSTDDTLSIRTYRPVNTITTELKKWQAKATKAFRRQGNAEVEFVSDLIDPSLKSAIEGALSRVRHRDDVQMIFKHAILQSEAY